MPLAKKFLFKTKAIKPRIHNINNNNNKIYTKINVK